MALIEYRLDGTVNKVELAIKRKQYLRGVCMKICYKKLWMLLIQKDITKVMLRRDLGIAPGTMSKLNKGEEVSLSVLLRICEYLNCDIGDICEVIHSNKVADK